MGKLKDLTGQRFGKLTVIGPTEKRKGTSVVWRCKCDCGKETLVAAGSLVSGNTKSCGCLRFEARGKLREIALFASKDIAGQRFGKLVAIEPTKERKYGYVMWRCRCDCGNEKYVAAGNLVSGGVKSCGCGHKKNLTGQRFGRLTAVEPTEKRRGSSVVWKCQCDCGNESLVRADSLVRGNTKSCGCLRRKTLAPDEFVFE